MKSFLFLLLLLLSFQKARAARLTDTIHYTHDYFRQPLDLSPGLNANFGDIRANHFHSGLDYSTDHHTGCAVHAVADGYVSRIKIQSGGYGFALYITHPNGFVSVYGHLQRYAPAIAAYVLNYQYAHKTFEFDLKLPPEDLPVTKNMIVAFSGDSGFSGGPHLHFELRDAVTEEIINPLLMGITIADHTRPVIRGIYTFRLHKSMGTCSLEPIAYFPATRAGDGNYRLATPLMLAGASVLGIITDDTHDNSLLKHSVYSTSLYKDRELIFYSALSHFGFDQTRAVNSFLDYGLLENQQLHVQLSYIEAGNPLPVYGRSGSRGDFTIIETKPSPLYYLVSDAAGNTSRLDFTAQSSEAENRQRQISDHNYELKLQASRINPAGGKFPQITWNKDTLVCFDGSGRSCNSQEATIKIRFPAAALFSSRIIPFYVSHALPGAFTIGNRNIAVKDSLWIQIRPADNAELHSANWVLTSPGHLPELMHEDHGFLSGWINSFGASHLLQDKQAPIVRSVRPGSGKSLAFMITDNLSGIGSYSGEIDGKWELFQYDAKNHLLYSTFDTVSRPGKHHLRLTVSDKAGNTTTHVKDF